MANELGSGCRRWTWRERADICHSRPVRLWSIAVEVEQSIRQLRHEQVHRGVRAVVFSHEAPANSNGSVLGAETRRCGLVPAGAGGAGARSPGFEARTDLTTTSREGTRRPPGTTQKGSDGRRAQTASARAHRPRSPRSAGAARRRADAVRGRARSASSCPRG